MSIGQKLLTGKATKSLKRVQEEFQKEFAKPTKGAAIMEKQNKLGTGK